MSSIRVRTHVILVGAGGAALLLGGTASGAVSVPSGSSLPLAPVEAPTAVAIPSQPPLAVTSLPTPSALPLATAVPSVPVPTVPAVPLPIPVPTLSVPSLPSAPTLPLPIPSVPVVIPSLPVEIPSVPEVVPGLPVPVPTLPIGIPTLPVPGGTLPEVAGLPSLPTSLPDLTGAPTDVPLAALPGLPVGTVRLPSPEGSTEVYLDVDGDGLADAKVAGDGSVQRVAPAAARAVNAAIGRTAHRPVAGAAGGTAAPGGSAGSPSAGEPPARPALAVADRRGGAPDSPPAAVTLAVLLAGVVAAGHVATSRAIRVRRRRG